MSLSDVGITDSVAETGATFAENALIKARYYHSLSQIPTLADDGGFEIDALNGDPGVKSHRWIDETLESTDAELVEYTLKRLQGIPLEKRQAQLRLVLALIIAPGKEFTTEAAISGIVPLVPAPKIIPGFPYRSLLFLPELNKFYDHAQLTPEETEQYNHRRRALEKLKPTIKKYLC